MNFLRYLFLLFFVMACTKNTSQQKGLDTPIKESSVAKTTTLSLNIIKKKPKEIEDCSCYFSSSKAAFAKGEYLYFDNYLDVAFLSINNQLVKFILAKEADPFGALGYTEEIWQADEYKLIIMLSQLGKQGEALQKKGEMILTSSEGQMIEQNIYGACKC